MNYSSFDTKLQGRNHASRKVANNTYLQRRPNVDSSPIALRLHNTDILTVTPDNVITVNSGGYKTRTTKARLNDYLPPGFGLYQSKGMWWWHQANGPVIGFTDGDKIVPDGNGWKLKAQFKPTDERRTAKLRRQILDYAKGFVETLPCSLPGAGDCLLCSMMVQVPHMSGKDHLLSHMKEKYYVPTLLWTAMEEAQCGPLLFSVAFKPGSGKLDKHWADMIRRALVRFLQKKLGLAR